MGYNVVAYDLVKDDFALVRERLTYYADDLHADLILTAGGTGLGPRDSTPEATMGVIEKRVPGISEFLRQEGFKETRRAALSRGVAGIRKRSLIVNFPGSLSAVRQYMASLETVLSHALDMIRGQGH
jgi:molybdenum cofactor synthesis domain-containing protein